MACQTVSFGPRFEPRSAPVTFWVLVAAAVVSVATFFAGSAESLAGGLVSQLVYSPAEFPARWWTLVTYPFLNLSSPFFLLLTGYCLWWAGTDLERWWGSRIQAGFLAAMSLGMALMVTFGAQFLPSRPPLLVGAEPWLAGIFTVWGLRNSRAQVILLIIPVSGAVIAGLAVAGVWFANGPLYGLFAALGTSGLAALYLYRGQWFHAALRKLPGAPDKRAARQRDRKFRKIMEKSGLHLVDDEKPRH